MSQITDEEAHTFLIGRRKMCLRVIVLGAVPPSCCGCTGPVTTLPPLLQRWGDVLNLDVLLKTAAVDAAELASCCGLVLGPHAHTQLECAVAKQLPSDLVVVEVCPGEGSTEPCPAAVDESEQFSSLAGPLRIYGRGAHSYRWALRHISAVIRRPPRTVVFETRGTQLEADLYMPTTGEVDAAMVPTRRTRHPLVVLVHGGFWRPHWKRDTMDLVAAELPARLDVVVMNTEYRTEHGARMAVADICAAMKHLLQPDIAARYCVDMTRVCVVGHSAGGQLALCAAAEELLRGEQLRGIVALAGVCDLEAAMRLGLGRGAVSRFLSTASVTEGEAGVGKGLGSSCSGEVDPDIQFASPLRRLPLGVQLELLHGTGDDLVPCSMSSSFAEAARAAGDDVRLTMLTGDGHFEFLDPWTSAFDATVAALRRLL